MASALVLAIVEPLSIRSGRNVPTTRTLLAISGRYGAVDHSQHVTEQENQLKLFLVY